MTTSALHPIFQRLASELMKNEDFSTAHQRLPFAQHEYDEPT
jgi:hypothetical protein